MSEPCAVVAYDRNRTRNTEIVERREDRGQWPTEIAHEMGLSRKLVIGVLYRNGCCDPATRKNDAIRIGVALARSAR